MNIAITSNFANDFVHQSTHSSLHHQSTTNTPTACLHHHLRVRPTVPSHQCNHYALLEPQPNVDNSISCQVHSGNACAEEDKTLHDLSHDHAINIKHNAMNNCETNVNGGNSNRVMKKITNNKRSKDHIKNYHFYNKSRKKLSATNTQDPFSDSDTETEVESASSCDENNKDKEPKKIKKKKDKAPKNIKKKKDKEPKKITKYFATKPNKGSKHTCKQPKRMAKKKFEKLSKEEKKEEKRRYVYFSLFVQLTNHHIDAKMQLHANANNAWLKTRSSYLGCIRN